MLPSVIKSLVAMAFSLAIKKYGKERFAKAVK